MIISYSDASDVILLFFSVFKYICGNCTSLHIIFKHVLQLYCAKMFEFLEIYIVYFWLWK